MSPTSSATSAPAPASSSVASAISSATSSTEDEFLQLLVAQLQNQDPTQPMDTSTMVTQLAQVQDLQENITTAQNTTAMAADLNNLFPATPSAGAAGSTTNPT